jgi:hypothetical protein
MNRKLMWTVGVGGFLVAVTDLAMVMASRLKAQSSSPVINR